MKQEAPDYSRPGWCGWIEWSRMVEKDGMMHSTTLLLLQDGSDVIRWCDNGMPDMERWTESPVVWITQIRPFVQGQMSAQGTMCVYSPEMGSFRMSLLWNASKSFLVTKTTLLQLPNLLSTISYQRGQRDIIVCIIPHLLHNDHETRVTNLLTAQGSRIHFPST